MDYHQRFREKFALSVVSQQDDETSSPIDSILTFIDEVVAEELRRARRARQTECEEYHQEQRAALIEKVEGMRKAYGVNPVIMENACKMARVDGYNRAIDDVLSIIRDNK